MKNLLKILLIVLLTSCATLTYDYDDVYYTTEQTVNFIPGIYQYYTPPLIFYWDYTYSGWQYNIYCNCYQYYSWYSCRWYNYYWIYNQYPRWYAYNHYYGRRYSPMPNHKRQVQKITTPNQRPVTSNKRQIIPKQRPSNNRTRQITPKRRPPTYQNFTPRTQSNKNKSHIYNRSTPQRRSEPQRINPIRTAPKSKIGARRK